MLVDTKSRELAQHFLQDHKGHTEADVKALAETIQQSVEAWLQGYEEGRQR